jgi:hypothetical protein
VNAWLGVSTGFPGPPIAQGSAGEILVLDAAKQLRKRKPHVLQRCKDAS